MKWITSKDGLSMALDRNYRLATITLRLVVDNSFNRE
jgi:hypothetical protein